MLQSSIIRVLALPAFLLTFAAAPLTGQSQRGQITGTVTNSITGGPVGAVQVFVEGSTRGTVTRADGTFTIADVPSGTHTVIARSIGYQIARRPEVAVAAGLPTPLDLSLHPAVVALDEVVASGLIDPTEGRRSPITVARVTRDQVPFASRAQPLDMLRGVVPGVTVIQPAGQPGAEATLLLRTPTSIRGSNAPLLVVDGVILGSRSLEIEPLNIESIEVLKGATATSLYGTRGASGVISIRTSRGTHLPAGNTRFSTSTEVGVGVSTPSFELPTHHQYLVDSQGNYVNRANEPVQRSQRVEPSVAFMDRSYTVPLFDNLGSAYKGGSFRAHSFAVDGNLETTNFSMSVTQYDEGGAIEGNGGYDRSALRANLDHRFLGTFSLGINAYHARSNRDLIDGGPAGSVLGSAMHDVLATAPDIDLLARGSNGEFLLNPDPVGLIENPLWRQETWESDNRRNRTIGSATLNWSPLQWLSASGDFGFDREENRERTFSPKGTPESVIASYPGDGSISYSVRARDTFNGAVQATLRRHFGDLSARTTVRAVGERDAYEMLTAVGENFNTHGVPRINATTIRRGGGDIERVRSMGYLWDTGIDYAGKYIAQGMLRWEASSLFAPTGEGADREAPWHDYYRVAAAYRISEEPWFNVGGIDELKLRYARGTAGNRPLFLAQYDAYLLQPFGVSRQGLLGNPELVPETTTEQEFGLDLILGGRVGLELVHARQVTKDQYIDLPVSSAIGFMGEWVNLGAVEGNTTELRIETRPIERPNLTWSTTLVADRSRSELTGWDRSCLIEGVTRLCNGSSMRDIWAQHWITSPDELPQSLRAFSSEFQVNDDGYLVWVGQGNSFRDGVTKELWGTYGVVGGQRLGWGLPLLETDSDGVPVRRQVGTGDADVQFGWINTVRLGNLTLGAQINAAFGNDLVNLTRQYLAQSDRLDEMDQAGKPDELKKPMHYYRYLAADNQYTDHFVEDASFVKLRTLSATYRFDEEGLRRVGLARTRARNLEVSLIARNVLTLTGYSGFDPEFQGHDASISTWSRLIPFDFYGFPQRPTVAASIGISF